MHTLDWTIFIAYLVLVFLVGIWVSKKSSKGVESYFVADRSLPWWWLGISIIATTFAADTPLAVTGITAKTGIAGNWFWWAWAATYITVAIFFAKRWRNAKVLTDVEFIELRYSGKEAAFLRGFKAFFYGIAINVFILGWVITAAVKIADAFIQWQSILGEKNYQIIAENMPLFLQFKGDPNASLTILALLLIVMIYSSLGGIRGVILTDLLQFVIAIVVSVLFAYFAVQVVGGLGELQSQLVAIYGAEKTQYLTEFIPSFNNPLIPFQIFLIYVTIQWWVRYDSDGSGYIAQRINTAKSAEDAQKGALLFAVAFVALRSWPWILVALVSLVLYPLQYDAAGTIIGDREMYYPLLMSTILPIGLVGLAFTSLMAALMSTVDTHLNWGASYLTNDIYRRFINLEAKQKDLIRFSRTMVICISILAILVAAQMSSIADAWKFFINAASGLGVAQLLRWFWWRANAWTEISAMLTALFATIFAPILFAEYTHLAHFDSYALVGIALSSLLVAVLVSWFTPAVEENTLNEFIERCQPVGFWQGKGMQSNAIKGFGYTAIMWLLGLTCSFSALFSIGYFLMLKPYLGILNIFLAIASFTILNRTINKEAERK